MRPMVDVLGEIVARKRIDVAVRLRGLGLDRLREKARPTRRSLGAALARPGGRFIMEVKRGSPSQGLLRANVDPARSDEHTTHLQSLNRLSYAVFCLKHTN